MKLSKRHLKRYLLTVSRGADRSPLFWWMVEHFEETTRAAQGQRMPWVALCAQFAAFGLTDGKGNPPSQEAARRTWRAVRAEMAKPAASTPAIVTATPKHRSRPRDWQPPETLATTVPRREPKTDWLPRDGPPPSAPGPATRRPDSPEEAERRIAELRRTFAKRSGH